MKSKIKIFNSATGYDLAADNYDKKEKYLNSFENGQFLEMLGDVKDKKILDVGAGSGRISGELSKLGAKITALDVSSKMLEKLKAKKFKNVETVVGDAENLPFEDETFDIVVATFLVVHLKNPKYFFAESYRVLKPNGILLVSNINQKEPPEIPTKEGVIKIDSFYHRPEQIKEQMEELAFGVEEKFIYENNIWVNQILKGIK